MKPSNNVVKSFENVSWSPIAILLTQAASQEKRIALLKDGGSREHS